MPRTSSGAEPLHAVEREQAFVAALDAVDLPAAIVPGEDDGPDDRVESGGVAAAGVDGDSHEGFKASGLQDFKRFTISCTTSPGFA